MLALVTAKRLGNLAFFLNIIYSRAYRQKDLDEIVLAYLPTYWVQLVDLSCHIFIHVVRVHYRV